MRLFRYLLFILITAVWAENLYAQNLINNPSFEEKNCCPDGYSQFHCTNTWTRPTKGTSDYYNGCKNKFYNPEVKVPQNFFGYQAAFDGDAYVGIYTFYKDSYREYIQIELDSVLIKDKKYGFSIQTSLADKAGIAVNSLGVAFSDTLVKQRDLLFTLKLPHEKLQNKSNSFLDNKEKWTDLYIDYIAKGGEKFIIIGNFLENQVTDTTSIITEDVERSERFAAYYYLDNICFAPWQNDNTCTCFNNGQPPIIAQEYSEISTVIKENIPKVGEKFILENIYFETAKANLLPESFQTLDSLYNLLIKYPTMEILISGHTDSEGKHKYNLVLSESRALAVYSYLIERGISSLRLNFKGFGKMQPIATNETIKGRQINRRVEFEIVKISVE